ncbi:MAG TPA: hypothetical protein VH986_04985 [Acidimicrobiia bacterium]
MRRRGGTGRVAAIAACALALSAVVVLPACGNPTQSVRNCVGAPEDVVQAIQQKVTGAQKLRNGKMVHLENAEWTFVSAELHPFSDAPHDKGDIATWATKDIKSNDGFVSVDVHAREESTWPPASFNVTADGAIESRACTGLSTGKTRAQVQCESEQASGQQVNLPKGKDCSDL